MHEIQTEYMARIHCGPWPVWVLALYIGANVLIGGAYFDIARTLWRLRRRTSVVPINQPLVALPFGLFILLCGLGHWLENVGAFFLPAYPAFAIWHASTAVVSVWTAIAMRTV